MKIKTLALLGIALVVAGVVFYSWQGNPSPADYARKLEAERREKDLFMRTSPESPFVRHPEECKPLNYFPPDTKYIINATFLPAENGKIIFLPTSDGKEKEYREFGAATFSLDGVKNTLMILEITEPGPYHGTLFLAFADATSARETYGAGRYLELKKIPGASSIFLDFNEAYNPYCAYTANFSCPFPPRENVLRVAIRAGEKSFH
jgi:uncharacterized protein (DUF1684 family)